MEVTSFKKGIPAKESNSSSITLFRFLILNIVKIDLGFISLV